MGPTDKQRLVASVRRAIRLDLYTADDPTPSQLVADMDDNLFANMLHNPHHVLHKFLPGPQFSASRRNCPLKETVRPPSLICFTHVSTTYKEYLAVFMTVQNLVGIGAVVSVIIMQVVIFCTLGLKMPIHTPKIVFFGFNAQNGEQY